MSGKSRPENLLERKLVTLFFIEFFQYLNSSLPTGWAMKNGHASSRQRRSVPAATPISRATTSTAALQQPCYRPVLVCLSVSCHFHTYRPQVSDSNEATTILTRGGRRCCTRPGCLTAILLAAAGPGAMSAAAGLQSTGGADVAAALDSTASALRCLRLRALSTALTGSFSSCDSHSSRLLNAQ